MLFSSVTFLFIFLPFSVIIYYLLPKFLRNWFLLLISILFYAWGEPRYLPIMFAVIMTNYIGALLINKFERQSKFWLFATIFTNIAFLVYFKYFNFLIDNYNLIFHSKIPLLNIALPLGISFYTFQAMSYTIDVYRKIVSPQKNFFKLALFISLFPQLIAGPIVKYHDIEEQIDGREESVEKVYYGLCRFIVGLSKKVLIANTLGAIATNIFAQPMSDLGTVLVWAGAILWTLQVYYDFSGYSDMAIGLGAIFGFKFMENFNYPYISRTISEYWRRWHISLGTWCKDYIYIPMGGSRVATWRIYFNLFFLFLIIGIWHGASWNFILFGLWNAGLIIFERATNLNKTELSVFGKIITHIYTLIAIMISSILGSAKDLPQAWGCITNMFSKFTPNETMYHTIYYFDRYEFIIFIIAIIFCVPIFKGSFQAKNALGQIGINLVMLVLLVLSCAEIASSTYNPFLYFRF